MKHIKVYLASLLIFIPAISHGAAQCGNFKFTINSQGKAFINGEPMTSQKVTFLKAQNDWDQIKLDMTLMPARDGLMYGYEFIKQDGKAFLNVELIRTRADAPRFIGSFGCQKVPD